MSKRSNGNRRWAAGLALGCAAGLLLPATANAGYHHFDGSTSNDWFDATNWSNNPGVPGTGDTAFIAGGFTADINGSGAVAGWLRIGQSGTGPATLNIKSGDLTVTSGGYLKFENAAPIVNQSGGTVTTPSLDFAGGTTPTYNLSGGTLNVNGALLLNANGLLNQTGGNLTLTGYINLGTNGQTGTYQISGGSFDASAVGHNAFKFGYGGHGTFRVIGSGASLVKIHDFRYDAANSDPHLDFVLDNSANHITALTVTGEYQFGGELGVDLQGGVLLSGQTSFDLVNAGQAITSGNYTARPVLWDTGFANSNKTLIVSLETSENQGTLAFNGSASFTAATLGYVDLTGIDANSTTLDLYMDITGDTGSDIADYIAALNAAGVTAAASNVTGYDILLTLNPQQSGSNVFAWDLTKVNAALGGANMKVGGLSLLVPEPASGVLLLLGGALMMLPRRKRGSHGEAKV